MSIVSAAGFDAFGTIADVRTSRRPWAKAIRGIGDPVVRAEAARAALTGTWNLRRLASSFGAGLDESALAGLEAEEKLETGSLFLYGDFIDTAAALDKAGMPWGVLSNLATPYAVALRRAFAEAGLRPSAFEMSCETGMAKPSREAFAALAAAMGVGEPDTLFTGDRETDDGDGARGAGMMFRRINRRAGETLHAQDLLTPVIWTGGRAGGGPGG